MDKIEITLTERTVTGNKNRFLRRAGVTPCHIFGHNIPSETLQADTAALQHVISVAGKTRLVSMDTGAKEPRMAFIREVQRTPVGANLLHVDFYQVKMTEKITAKIPLHLIGEAPALKTKGRILAHPIAFVEVESLPAKLPASINIDISVLATLEDAIHVRDLKLDSAVTVLTDPDALIAKVGEISVKAEAEEVAAAAVAAPAEGAAAE
ncbi:50S ribosomal protein L25 [Dehalogenimonas sp. THU2]|uniref:50S ribosomal protein L25 n=1 Tax=Dehalogenimonas sp. THU2 TaxID=3151121 RepID=UPI0032182A3E